MQLFKSGLFKSIVPNLNITAFLSCYRGQSLYFSRAVDSADRSVFVWQRQPVPERLGLYKGALLAFGWSAGGWFVAQIRGVGSQP